MYIFFYNIIYLWFFSVAGMYPVWIICRLFLSTWVWICVNFCTMSINRKPDGYLWICTTGRICIQIIAILELATDVEAASWCDFAIQLFFFHSRKARLSRTWPGIATLKKRNQWKLEPGTTEVSNGLGSPMSSSMGLSGLTKIRSICHFVMEADDVFYI